MNRKTQHEVLRVLRRYRDIRLVDIDNATARRRYIELNAIRKEIHEVNELEKEIETEEVTR